jgi:flagellar hook-basal body complex protein FliE
MNFATVMAKVIPGTFVPDMRASEKPTISNIPGMGNAGASTNAVTSDPNITGVAAVGGVPSFKDTLQQMLGDVNDKINTSDQKTRDLASGKTNDLNGVVTSVEEANLSLQYTMAIRTKLLTAYNQIAQMSV